MTITIITVIIILIIIIISSHHHHHLSHEHHLDHQTVFALLAFACLAAFASANPVIYFSVEF